MVNTHIRTMSTKGAMLWSAAALALYLVMVLGPLAQLAEISGGRVFDMRPGGYDLGTAVSIHEALGAEGRALYRQVQIPLDMIYPALMGMMLCGWLGWSVARGAFAWLLPVGLVVIWAGVASDYAENILVFAILGADGPSPQLVSLASAATVAKSALTTGAICTVLIAIMAAQWCGRRRSRAGSA